MPELVLHVETCEFLFPSPGGDVLCPGPEPVQPLEMQWFPSPGGDVLCLKARDLSVEMV